MTVSFNFFEVDVSIPTVERRLNSFLRKSAYRFSRTAFFFGKGRTIPHEKVPLFLAWPWILSAKK
jgi:hypothetical protein